jgi:predicted transcriptional regulator YdeE
MWPVCRLAMSVSVSLVLLLLAISLADSSTPPKVVRHESFNVMGIEVRTSNGKEATSEGLIGKQWQRIFGEDLLQKIPNKMDRNIYAVYSNYASDHNGEYTYTLGARVADGTQAPAGFVIRNVAAGNYALVTTEKGPVAQVVSAAWKTLWTMEDDHMFSSPRAYKTDFELYDQRAVDPENSQVDIYVGLK